MHAHGITQECAADCPGFNPNGWACGACGRQLPMVADTEDWATPCCIECFKGTQGEDLP